MLVVTPSRGGATEAKALQADAVAGLVLRRRRARAELRLQNNRRLVQLVDAPLAPLLDLFGGRGRLAELRTLVLDEVDALLRPADPGPRRAGAPTA